MTRNQQPVLQSFAYLSQPKDYDVFGRYLRDVKEKYPQIFGSGNAAEIGRDGIDNDLPGWGGVKEPGGGGGGGYFDHDDEDEGENISNMPSLFWRPSVIKILLLRFSIILFKTHLILEKKTKNKKNQKVKA